MSTERTHIETQVIQGTHDAARFEGAQVTPIVRSTVFEAGEQVDYHNIRYGRLSTLANQLEAAQVLARVERAEAGLVTSSGMAAITTTLIAVLRSGGHVLAQRPLYGATQQFVSERLGELGIGHGFIDVRKPETWQAALTPDTRAIYVEAISNPLLVVADHARIVEFARAHGLVSIIDNTFASPVNFRPIELGFDLVLHSATKYLNGHSDVIMGAVLGSADRIRSIKLWLDTLGGTADPEACYLLRRGLKTLALRVERQNANALALARHLETHARVAKVIYPGLASHPDHAVAARLFGGFGGMLACELTGGAEAAARFVRRVKVAVHSASLGGPETLLTIPATTSHAGLGAEARARAGISEGLVRISTGFEHIDDLIRDFDAALAGDT
ncbi:MAG TPA: aminotransferase class I/II-fold pyridoxal phosphate-dependent enzyme [Polyangiaceae bacterium]|nr:aminotransferase class I/II-fold pyridoxal phosphate-dependent enzyme [Polyangiaceae bacterium]